MELRLPKFGKFKKFDKLVFGRLEVGEWNGRMRSPKNGAQFCVWWAQSTIQIVLFLFAFFVRRGSEEKLEINMLFSRHFRWFWVVVRDLNFGSEVRIWSPDTSSDHCFRTGHGATKCSLCDYWDYRNLWITCVASLSNKFWFEKPVNVNHQLLLTVLIENNFTDFTD